MTHVNSVELTPEPSVVGAFLPEDKEQKETGGIRRNTSPFLTSIAKLF
jgi:hypothetical protein